MLTRLKMRNMQISSESSVAKIENSRDRLCLDHAKDPALRWRTEDGTERIPGLEILGTMNIKLRSLTSKLEKRERGVKAEVRKRRRARSGSRDMGGFAGRQESPWKLTSVTHVRSQRKMFSLPTAVEGEVTKRR